LAQRSTNPPAFLLYAESSGEEPVSDCNHERHLPVAKGTKALALVGHPMSHSTQTGLSFGGVGRPLADDERPRPRSSRTASVNEIPQCALLVSVFRLPLASASPFVGVGQSRRGRVGGEYPNTVATVIGSNVGRSQHEPFRIEPALGQVSENGAEIRVSNESCRVFQKRSRRSNSAKGGDSLGPSVAVVIVAEFVARSGERLARKASGHDVDPPGEELGGESRDVVENREVGKRPVGLPSSDDRLPPRVDFDRSDGFPTEQERRPKPAAGSRE
jgi:hypothetical protein